MKLGKSILDKPKNTHKYRILFPKEQKIDIIQKRIKFVLIEKNSQLPKSLGYSKNSNSINDVSIQEIIISKDDEDPLFIVIKIITLGCNQLHAD